MARYWGAKETRDASSPCDWGTAGQMKRLGAGGKENVPLGCRDCRSRLLQLLLRGRA